MDYPESAVERSPAQPDYLGLDFARWKGHNRQVHGEGQQPAEGAGGDLEAGAPAQGGAEGWRLYLGRPAEGRTLRMMRIPVARAERRRKGRKGKTTKAQVAHPAAHPGPCRELDRDLVGEAALGFLASRMSRADGS